MWITGRPARRNVSTSLRIRGRISDVPGISNGCPLRKSFCMSIVIRAMVPKSGRVYSVFERFCIGVYFSEHFGMSKRIGFPIGLFLRDDWKRGRSRRAISNVPTLQNLLRSALLCHVDHRPPDFFGRQDIARKEAAEQWEHG